MQNRMNRDWHSIDLFFSLSVLGLLFLFTYAFFQVPYAGFYFHPSTGEVLEIYVNPGPPNFLQLGDILDQVGDTSFESYRRDSTQSLFEGVQAGDTLDIALSRDGRPLTISWMIPGFSSNEFFARLFNVWWLAYIFWVLGLVVQLSVRPRDSRWRSLIAACYLTALWLVLGTMSSSHLWGSSLLLRAVTWLILPVYWNLHWVFPRSLAQVPKAMWLILYLISGLLAVGELLQFLPRSLYALGFLFAFLGSLLLLFAHLIWQPAQRRDVRLLLAMMLVAVLPSISLGLVRTIGNVPVSGPWGLLALPILPISYVYIIYRQNLGGLEVRANRVISIYVFLILLSTFLLLLATMFAQLSIQSEAMPFLTVVVGCIVAAISIIVYPRFQAFLEQRFMGINLPYKNLQEIYSTRITTSTSLQSLLELLNNEVIPSLLVRQFAFIQLSSGSPKVSLLKGITLDQLEQGDALESVAGLAKAGISSAPLAHDPTLHWVRLVLPLNIGGELIGLWLLGERDPDNMYPQAEIPILQSLANQTAVALSNIIQTERLKVMYEANLNRYEQERLRLARDLHDSVLNEMAAILLKTNAPSLHPDFEAAYRKSVSRVREIVSDLRPPMLVYGLKNAFEALADNLSERNQDVIQIASSIEAGEAWRYPEFVENNIYRIVQEACENALRYANASSIRITGELNGEGVDIQVIDDGIGFKDEPNLKLDGMLANRHFGLAGMHERAELIGAEIKIDSKPNGGTKIRTVWKSKHGQ